MANYESENCETQAILIQVQSHCVQGVSSTFGFMGTAPSKRVEGLGPSVAGTWNAVHPPLVSCVTLPTRWDFSSPQLPNPKPQQAYARTQGAAGHVLGLRSVPFELSSVDNQMLLFTTFYFSGSHKPRETNQGGPRWGGRGQGRERPGRGCGKAPLGRAGSAAQEKSMLVTTFAGGKPRLRSGAYGEQCV